MTLLITSVLVVLVVSALCSLTEAALYAVRLPYIRQLREGGSIAGRILTRFKKNMEQPITAILIVNTAANTAGAAIAGAQAQSTFGAAAVAWFSIVFTLLVLFFAEILPKIAGVAYSERVARTLAIPLDLVIRGLMPLVWLVQLFAGWVKPDRPTLYAPEEEVRQMVLLSLEEGSILPVEAKLVQNVLKLDDIRARDIMTPRSVVFKLPANLTLREVAQRIKDWSHSRIPIYDPNDPEIWAGIVLSRDILTRLARDEFDVTLQSISKPLFFVHEKTPGHVLLRAFLRRRTHLFAVMQEGGGLIGIVTLEDLLESLIGEEIVDEADTVVDMQEFARLRHRQAFETGGAHEPAVE